MFRTRIYKIKRWAGFCWRRKYYGILELKTVVKNHAILYPRNLVKVPPPVLGGG